MKQQISNAIANNAALTEESLLAYLNQNHPLYGKLYDGMRYAVLDGGKRIRPFLVLEFCRMYGGDDRCALPLACALELIHSYSLVHDDLPCMDNDTERRGKPSCHVQYGEADALLIGDALLTYAFEIVAKSTALTPSQIQRAVLVLAQCAGADGMIGGQVIDLMGEKEALDYDSLLCMNRKKTGALMQAACVLGCIAAGHEDTASALQYAEYIGLTFQLTDDLLDAGTEDGKTTFLSFMTQEQARALADRWTAEAKDAIVSEENSDLLCRLSDYLLHRVI